MFDTDWAEVREHAAEGCLGCIGKLWSLGSPLGPPLPPPEPTVRDDVYLSEAEWANRSVL